MIPTLTERTADESLPTYGARVLGHVIAHGTAGVDSNDALELAAHFAINLHTQFSTDAITAAVIEIRNAVAGRRATVRVTLLALGFTDEPLERAEPGQAPAANGLTGEEITFLKNLYKEVKGELPPEDGGARVPRRPRTPTQPPAGGSLAVPR